MFVVVQEDYVVELCALLVLAGFDIRKRQNGTCHLTILRGQPLGLQLTESPQPAFIVVRFVLEELGDFRMGKHQKLLGFDRSDRRIGDNRWFDCSFMQESCALKRRSSE